MVHVCYLLQYLGKYFKVLTRDQHCEQHMGNEMTHKDQPIYCECECPRADIHDDTTEHRETLGRKHDVYVRRYM